MALVPQGNGPYAPALVMTGLFTRFRDRGLPSPVTREVLERAGVTETLSGRTVQALRLLDVIDTEGVVNPAFEALNRLPDADYKEALGEYIAAAYADVISFADPATDSYEQVRDAFRPYNPKGQQERMVTLFLGLLEFAGMDVSAAMANRGARTESPARKANAGGAEAAGGKTEPRRRQRKNPETKEAVIRVGDDSMTGELPPGLVGLLRQIPRNGAAWTAQRRDEFLAAFTAVLDFSVPVAESTVTKEADDD